MDAVLAGYLILGASYLMVSLTLWGCARTDGLSDRYIRNYARLVLLTPVWPLLAVLALYFVIARLVKDAI